MAGNSADTGRSVTSKVVSILLTFTDGNVQSLTEIARLAGLPVSTAHRLVTELAAWGVLERTDDAHYRPGVPLRVIGSQAVHAASLHERARRVMEDVVTATRANVRLGVLEGLEVAYTEKLVGHRPVSIFAGDATVPAHATAMGKALLAFSPPAVVDALLERGLERFTPYTLTTPDRLRRALAVIRLTRVALCRWELELGAAAVAVPVFGGGGTRRWWSRPAACPASWPPASRSGSSPPPSAGPVRSRSAGTGTAPVGPTLRCRPGRGRASRSGT
jgi:DNA-binding IclR family transcriptional regulator